MKSNYELLSQVREALAKNEKINKTISNLYILVNDGTVILSGSAADYSIKKTAEKIVSAIPGVARVIEDLSFEPANSNRVSVQLDWAQGKMSVLPRQHQL
jgi:osmotically-inducible protein OsmY